MPQQRVSLPQHLLEQLLITGTSIEEKKTLRQLCKHFQQVLDDNLICINLDFQQQKDRRCLEKLLERMEHMSCLRAVTFGARYYNDLSRIPYSSMGRMLKYLPTTLNKLIIHSKSMGSKVYLQQLRRLPCLTSLYLGNGMQILGMEYVSGLTHLECCGPVGSLAHLAPTLKHLVLWMTQHAQDIRHLTNLEMLKIRGGVPAPFFLINGQLPLKHLFLGSGLRHPVCQCIKAWKAAPKTLTCLTLDGVEDNTVGALPPGITHLQLLNTCQSDIKRATTLLPNVKRLDLHVHTSPYYNWQACFSNLPKFTKSPIKPACSCSGCDLRRRATCYGKQG